MAAPANTIAPTGAIAGVVCTYYNTEPPGDPTPSFSDHPLAGSDLADLIAALNSSIPADTNKGVTNCPALWPTVVIVFNYGPEKNLAFDQGEPASCDGLSRLQSATPVTATAQWDASSQLLNMLTAIETS